MVDAFASVLSGITGVFGKGFFWLLIIVTMVGLAVFILWIQKRKRLRFTTFEIIDLGNDKIDMFKTKAGWFGRRSVLFGLWDVGNEKILKTKQGKVIEQFSTEDFNRIGTKPAIICMRKADDPRVLIPIQRFKLTERSKLLIGSVAAADYRDAAVNIVKEATKETQSTMDRILPFIALGAIIVFFVIAVIFASQTFNRAIDKASDLVLEAGKIVANAASNANTLPSKAP